MKFTIEKKHGTARAGRIETMHGVIQTPAFVPVGTKATVKSLTPEQVVQTGAQVVLGNTYHLYLEPGQDIVARGGGLGKFMNWKGPTITDSGGFQVFSLGAAYGKGISKVSKTPPEELLLPESNDDDGVPKLVSIDHDGVMFRSHKDGSAHYFTPEKSIDIQHKLGADIFFAFDECTSPQESYHYQREALDRTHRWAKKCLAHHKASEYKDTQALFGVVQGGRHEDLRTESAQVLGAMDFDGYGIGGSFAKEDMSTAVKWVTKILPEEKPRHLLGIGEPEDLCMGIEQGIDLFDCVAPTRMGRTGSLYTRTGKINIMNTQYTDQFVPIDDQCGCYTCINYTCAYLAHLFRSKEMLAATLASIHNVFFIVQHVNRMRQALIDGTFDEYKTRFLKEYTRV